MRDEFVALRLESADKQARPFVIRSPREVLIGRSRGCEIRFPNAMREISRVHGCIRFDDQGWCLIDQSSAGTYVNDLRVESGVRHWLHDGDRLRVGSCELVVRLGLDGGVEEAAGSDEYEITTSHINLAELDTTKVLMSALELPELLTEAGSEAEVFEIACEYLVRTLAPTISSAHVVVAPSDEGVSLEVIAGRRRKGDGTTLAFLTASSFSKSILDRVRKDRDSVVFLHRRHPEATIDATVESTVSTVGACLIEHGQAGDLVFYVLGDSPVTVRVRWIAEYLRLVATLTKQHILLLRRAHLSKYFSPRVVTLLMQGGGRHGSSGESALTEATSLFIDLRGFSLSVEASAAHLLGCCRDLVRVMTIISKEIFGFEGTIIDYQGDGVFAAWGVPFPQPNQVRMAVECALSIIGRLRNARLGVFGRRRTMRDAVCGIGIARGEVVAGNVGSSSLFKFGLLGPSVNEAKRLESLTKPDRLNAPILISEEVRVGLDGDDPRIRLVALGSPGEMRKRTRVYEVVVPDSESERCWLPHHDKLWNSVAETLFSARSLGDLQKVEETLSPLPAEHPRVIWLRATIERLVSETPRGDRSGKQGCLSDVLFD